MKVELKWLVEERVFLSSDIKRWRARAKKKILELLSGTSWVMKDREVKFKDGNAYLIDGQKEQELRVICGPTGNFENSNGKDILVINLLRNHIGDMKDDVKRKGFEDAMLLLCSKSKIEGEFADRIDIIRELSTIKGSDEENKEAKRRDILDLIFLKDKVRGDLAPNGESGSMLSQLIKPLYDEDGNTDRKETIKKAKEQGELVVYSEKE